LDLYLKDYYPCFNRGRRDVVLRLYALNANNKNYTGSTIAEFKASD